jgi:prophage regulatory protein
MNTNAQPKILRKPEVIKMAGFSKSTLYNRIQQGLWPKPISLGFRAIGFVQSECEAVLKAMIAEQSPEQIKTLVQELIAQRKQLA